MDWFFLLTPYTITMTTMMTLADESACLCTIFLVFTFGAKIQKNYSICFLHLIVLLCYIEACFAWLFVCCWIWAPMRRGLLRLFWKGGDRVSQILTRDVCQLKRSFFANCFRILFRLFFSIHKFVYKLCVAYLEISCSNYVHCKLWQLT